MAAVVTAWASLLFGLMGIGLLVQFVVKFLSSATGGLR